MKYIGLVFASFRRKKIRTGLTAASFMVALFLFGLLVAIHTAFYQGIELAGVDRLVVISRTSLIQPLPMSYREKLTQIPGVKDITYATWFGGVYRDERNFFPQMAIDTESYKKMYPEFIIPDEQWKSFLTDRQGALVGVETAKRFGWKIGDRIPIRGTYIPGNFEFNIRAIYKGKRRGDDTTQFFFHHKLFDERVPEWFRGHVGWYVIRVTDRNQTVSAAKAIDQRFANSAYETKTETEREFAASFAKQMGNIELLITAIGSVVFLTLLLITGNTMAIAVRERTPEIAVLKTVGFSNLKVLVLILAESAFISLIGGGLGLMAAKAMAPKLSSAIPGLIFHISLDNLAMGFGLTLLVGLMAGLIPAILAMRLSVVDALRRV